MATTARAYRLHDWNCGTDRSTEKQSWVFTFGFGHTHPSTGERLANCYIVIEGDINESREVMAQHFGNKWAFQYADEESAGVQRYGLRKVSL